MVVSSLSLSTICFISGSRGRQPPHQPILPWSYKRCLSRKSRSFSVFAATEGSAKSNKYNNNNNNPVNPARAGSAKSNKSEEKIPSWAKPDSDEPPPWARDEGNAPDLKQSFEVPFIVYLLASAVTAIAAIGSVFEYVNQKPVFGVLNSDSIFYAPVLGFFVLTGIPTSAFLWFKSVETANKEAEEQDRRDGYK